MITLFTIWATTIDLNFPIVKFTIEAVRWDFILLAGFTLHKKKNRADGQQKEKEFCGLHNCRMEFEITTIMTYHQTGWLHTNVMP